MAPLNLGREKEIGSIAVGKNADLVVIKGDPSKQISDIEKRRNRLQRRCRLRFTEALAFRARQIRTILIEAQSPTDYYLILIYHLIRHDQMLYSRLAKPYFLHTSEQSAPV